MLCVRTHRRERHERDTHRTKRAATQDRIEFGGALEHAAEEPASASALGSDLRPVASFESERETACAILFSLPAGASSPAPRGEGGGNSGRWRLAGSLEKTHQPAAPCANVCAWRKTGFYGTS